MQTNHAIRYAPLLFSIYTLLYVAAINADSPFRGEHWALLYGYLHSRDWGNAVANVSSFVCFGVKRFQPLAFFPAILSYILLGTNFLAHQLLSVLLHVLYTLVFLQLLNWLRTGETAFSVYRLRDFPLEAALFLVFFSTSDVLTWTFFHYIQVATILGMAAFLMFIDGKKHLAYALVAGATLIYEPFYSLAIGFVLWEIRQSYRKKHPPPVSFWGLLLLVGGIGAQYFSQYSGYVNQIASHNEIQRAMVETSIATKAFASLNKFVVLVLTLLYSASFPTLAVKKQIYELHTFPWIERGTYDYYTFTYLSDRTVWLTAAAGALLAGAVVWLVHTRKKNGVTNPGAPYLYCGIAFLLFAVIAWGRPVVRDYAIAFQFRYAMIGAALIVAVGLEILRWRLPASIYAGTLLVLIAINNYSYFRQGELVAKDMGDLASYVSQMREKGESSDAIVDKMASAFAGVTIPVANPDNELFTYNAQQCVVEWASKRY